MNTRITFALASLLIIFALSACGLTPAEKSATATQAAAVQFCHPDSASSHGNPDLHPQPHGHVYTDCYHHTDAHAKTHAALRRLLLPPRLNGWVRGCFWRISPKVSNLVLEEYSTLFGKACLKILSLLGLKM